MKLKSHKEHAHAVEQLRQTLKGKNCYFSLKSRQGSSNTLRNGAYKKNAHPLDFSSLDGILELNPNELWILVEPRITFSALCRFTLSYGLVPPVVPEFSSITVGGAIMGAALESSSHRFGQVNDTCIEYELLLGNADVITASDTQNRELFYAISGSYGTLALLTAVKLKLVHAKKWVQLNYHWFDNIDAAASMLTKPQSADYLEAIVYSPTQSVVITGNMTDHAEKKYVYRQNKPWSTWYVQHILNTPNPQEWMTLDEYLFRLDRGAFWIGRYVNSFKTMARLLLHLGIPKIKKSSFNPNFLFRFLFGWAFSSERLYQIWHKVPNHISEKLFLIHDFYAPHTQASHVLKRFMDQTRIFPIWLCPVKGTSSPQFLSPHFGGSNFLNIGLYGMPGQLAGTIPQLSQQLEQEIIQFGGRKMLYSFTYYDEETFSKIYSAADYTRLRKKFYADEAFPSLYKKVTNNSHF